MKFDGEDVQRMLLSITGFSEDDLYVCGFEGELWALLTASMDRARLADESAFELGVCGTGQAGVLLRGGWSLFALDADASWTDLSNKQVSKNAFYDMTIFSDRLYIAADRSSCTWRRTR